MAGLRSDATSVSLHFYYCNKKWEWQGKMHLCWLVCGDLKKEKCSLTVEVKGKGAFTSIIVPPICQFAPNLAQSLWMTSGRIELSWMLKAFSLTEIWNNVCFFTSKKDCLVITSRFFGVPKNVHDTSRDSMCKVSGRWHLNCRSLKSRFCICGDLANKMCSRGGHVLRQKTQLCSGNIWI